MIGFWISAIAMVLMVGLVLAQAMRRATPGAAQSAPAADIGVYRDQLAEVDQDKARGLLNPDEAERLRLEVQRRLLDADRRDRSAMGSTNLAGPALPLAAVTAALLAAIAIYAFDLGAPGYPDLPLADRLANADEAYRNRPSQAQAEAAQPAFEQPAELDQEMASLITQLRQALATRPDDLQGHVLLAQNEAQLGNFVAARLAQETVVRLKGDGVTAGDLAFLAHLMIGAAGGLVTPEAEATLIRCLTIDPSDGWGRYYSGLMFAQIGRPDRSFALWEPLLRDAPDGAAYLGPIRAMIEQTAAAAGITYALPDMSGPSTSDIAAAADMSDADRTEMIRTMVGGLEERLTAEGGPVEDWARLITSLGVLQDTDRARAAYQAAQATFAGKPGELAALKAAADEAGVAE